MPETTHLETTRLLKQIRRFVPTLLLGAAVLSCQGPEQPTEATTEGGDVTGLVPAGTHFTPSTRPQTSAGDAGTVILGFEGFPSITPLPTDAYAAQGVTVSGAVVLTAPGYNWSIYPPHGGAGVVTGSLDANPGTQVIINLAFDSAYTSVGLFATSQKPVTLTCVNANGALVGADSSRAPNLEDDAPFSLYPPNDHVEVTGTGIRACTIAGPGSRFVVDDVTLGHAPSLPPRFTAREHTVEPVISQVFDARAGTATNSRMANAPEQHRADTVSLVIGVDTSLGPVPSDTFWLETSVQSGSGYHMHDHATRPRGRLWLPSAAAAAAKGPGGDSVMQVTIPDTGRMRIIFRSSGVSGIEVIRLHRGSVTGTVVDSAIVTVKLEGLERMTRDVANLYYFKDQDTTIVGQGHGNFNDGVIPAFRDSVERAFHKYLDGGNDFLRGETRFVITEASLPWGGLLDISSPADQAWRWPHYTHRTGTDMDVRTHLPGDEPAPQRELFDARRRAAFLQACDSVVNCHYETPQDVPNPRPYHFHLKPFGATQ